MRYCSLSRTFASAGLLAMGLCFPTQTAASPKADGEAEPQPPGLAFLEWHCFECHDSLKRGGLNLEETPFDLNAHEHFETWVGVYDRVRSGEMPPKGKDRPKKEELSEFLDALSQALTAADRKRAAEHGRAQVRRLNRYEHENTLRDLLQAPWLMVAEELPADGTVHLFSKSSSSLDVSHVQMRKYLEVGKEALRTAVNAAAHPSQTHRYYARRDKGMSYVNETVRANVPIIGWEADISVITGDKPKTSDEPEIQEQEALATFYGAHPAYTRVDVLEMDPPIDGRYRLRVKSYSMAAGKNGYGKLGVDPEIPGRKHEQWYRPNRLDIRRSQRPEPITLYALRDSGDTRWLGSFDAQPDPHVVEMVVTLKAGDNLRPDAARLVRLRPGWKGNPLAVDSDHIPGWAIQWVEVEGPITDVWPPRSYQAVFGGLPFDVVDGQVRVRSEQPEADAHRLLADFATRAFRGRDLPEGALDDYMAIFEQAREAGYDFTDAMITACNAVLASPGFLYLQMEPGELDPPALAARLSYFLWNSAPDAELLNHDKLHDPDALRTQTDRLLNDPRSAGFVEHFLDHWLELRDLNNTVPDAELYPDYYLDSQLVESGLFETRTFFTTLIEENLPARNLIDSDFTFVNERLARHYGLDHDEPSVRLQRAELPEDSPRGGLLTQASVLKVTANGTTTSPVLRGVWAVERLLGIEIPEPPSGVEAIEPDTRGAVTIREQLARHTETDSCVACHSKFDPIGFALESFDVMGGWRDRYRALGDIGDPAEGYGMNGHAFTFRLAQPVECRGELTTGKAFTDIHGLKAALLSDERAIARNLVNQLVVYATGAPVSFADRQVVEKILDDAKPSDYGVRDLIHGIIQSRLFRHK